MTPRSFPMYTQLRTDSPTRSRASANEPMTPSRTPSHPDVPTSGLLTPEHAQYATYAPPEKTAPFAHDRGAHVPLKFHL